MSSRSCRECYAPFEGETWQKLCWTCWRERKDREGRQDEYQKGYIDGLIAGVKRAQLDPALLKRAACLTHPDRHDPIRFAEANEVTAALLSAHGELAA